MTEPIKIPIVVESFSILEEFQREEVVTVTGDDIEDGEYETTIMVPLRVPRKCISLNISTPEPNSCVVGGIYSTLDGMSFLWTGTKFKMTQSRFPLKNGEFEMPKYVVLSVLTCPEGNRQ